MGLKIYKERVSLLKKENILAVVTSGLIGSLIFLGQNSAIEVIQNFLISLFPGKLFTNQMALYFVIFAGIYYVTSIIDFDHNR